MLQVDIYDLWEFLLLQEVCKCLETRAIL